MIDNSALPDGAQVGAESMARADAIAFQLAVAAEDKAFLERIHTKALPLDATVEYHSKADRITLEMRRTLADLVSATNH